MIKFDDSSLNVEQRGKLPLYDGLEEFAMKVSLLKPMVNFVVDTNCISTKYETVENGVSIAKQYVSALYVYENGEKLGDISTDLRYRGREKELVYEVASFRIHKSRGSADTIASKDMKVALRTAKKMLVARVDVEAIDLIKRTVNSELADLHTRASNQLRWSMDFSTEALLYASKAYEARMNGQTYVELPTALLSVKDTTEHDKFCALAKNAEYFRIMHLNKQGYGVQKLDNGSFNVYHYLTNTLKKYPNYDHLPDAIQSKYAMFKVLKRYELVTTIGVWLSDNFYYVVE